MKFRPLHDRVVVRRITPLEKSAGGIIIPDTVKEKPMEGEIIAAGPGARNEQGVIVALDVKAGDRVLFGKWSGTEVKIDGEELLIMKESDLHRALSRARPPWLEESRLSSIRHGDIVTWQPKTYASATTHASRMLRGVDILADAVKVTLGAEGPQRRDRQELWRTAHHQGRCERRQGNRARREVREHGRADGA